MEPTNQEDNATEQPANPNLPRWAKSILELSEKIPQEALVPPDYSENLDHYLYGMPKKSQEPSDANPQVERSAPMATSSAKDKTSEQSDDLSMPSIQRKILARSAKIPQEELDKFPPDFTENLDHYLYGMPKKTP